MKKMTEYQCRIVEENSEIVDRVIRYKIKINGLRLPKDLLEAIGMKENDRVELIQGADTITIKKTVPVQHKTLEDRLTAFYRKPVSQIDRIENEEIGWGTAEGSEAW